MGESPSELGLDQARIQHLDKLSLDAFYRLGKIVTRPRRPGGWEREFLSGKNDLQNKVIRQIELLIEELSLTFSPVLLEMSYFSPEDNSGSEYSGVFVAGNKPTLKSYLAAVRDNLSEAPLFPDPDLLRSPYYIQRFPVRNFARTLSSEKPSKPCIALARYRPGSRRRPSTPKKLSKDVQAFLSTAAVRIPDDPTAELNQRTPITAAVLTPFPRQGTAPEATGGALFLFGGVAEDSDARLTASKAAHILQRSVFAVSYSSEDTDGRAFAHKHLPLVQVMHAELSGQFSELPPLAVASLSTMWASLLRFSGEIDPTQPFPNLPEDPLHHYLSLAARMALMRARRQGDSPELREFTRRQLEGNQDPALSLIEQLGPPSLPRIPQGHRQTVETHGFAVMAIFVLYQALFHSFRWLVSAESPPELSIHLDDQGGSLRLEVRNPGEEAKRVSKDAKELRSYQESFFPDGEVKGPAWDPLERNWTTVFTTGEFLKEEGIANG